MLIPFAFKTKYILKLDSVTLYSIVDMFPNFPRVYIRKQIPSIVLTIQPHSIFTSEHIVHDIEL